MISIVVPVYNVKSYLRRCIESILAQTYTHFELLLIDDGSDDGSGTICDEYAAQDSRVRAFHKHNGGVSSARNLGLDNARGEWISFCDADDYVSKYYLENLLSLDSDIDIDLIFNYAVIHCNGKEERESYPEKIIDIAELHDLFLNNELNWHTSTWSKLFKRSIIESNHIRFFTDVHIGEDLVFLYAYILKCRTIKVICTCDYHYIIRNTESLTHRVNSFESEKKGLKLIMEIVDQLRRVCTMSDDLNSKLKWITGSYKRRVLQSLYQDNIDRDKRLEYLRESDFSDYIQSIKEISIQGRVYKCILAFQHYKLYDFVRILVRTIRK